MTSDSMGSFWHRRDLLASLGMAACLGALANPPSARGGYPWQGPPARQVVVFGVMATPGGTEMDRKIAPVVQAQLRKLLPDHGFRLIKIKSERLSANGQVKCDLGGDFAANARLIKPTDPNGKILMQVELMYQEESQFQTTVTTPPDQFNFFDKSLDDGNHLLIGVGAR